MRRRHAVVLGLALPLAVAAPASAAQVEVKVDESGALPVWAPVELRIAAGDSLVWSFAGTVQPHNVKADGGPWSYRSGDVAIAPQNASVVFSTPGVYYFVCEAHSSMRGHVTVGNAPPPPPPPLSEQPFVNDGRLLGALETGGRDRTAPMLRAVRVRKVARGARVSFRVSERSRVTVRFKRRGEVFKTARFNASGRYRGTIRDARRLRAGRYRVELRAVDVAGNRSAVRRARVTLR
jgi:plastocyanin